MEKEKVIELLRKDLEGYKLRLKIEKIEENRKHFSEKIEAFRIAIKILQESALKTNKIGEQIEDEPIKVMLNSSIIFEI